jgi:nicotinamidase-related amidase
MRNFDENAQNACKAAITALADEVNALEPLPMSKLHSLNTALVIIDVVNGFIREGKMASDNIESIVAPVAVLLGEFKASGMPVIAFADCHSSDCAEFLSFPPHCLDNSSESELVDELKRIGGYTLIKKNSHNGFIEKAFAEFLTNNSNIDTFIVTGDCTDICVLQFCLSIKTWYTAKNENVRIIVPIDCVETYSSPGHNVDFMNIAAYKIMSVGGVEFVKSVVVGE